MFGTMRNPAAHYAKIGVESNVSTASPHQLILILFDGALAAIGLARAHMEAGKAAEKGEAISKAINLINNGLRASLNMEAGGSLAERLAALYEYMSQRLLFAHMKNNLAALDEVANLLQDIREAWSQIASDT